MARPPAWLALLTAASCTSGAGTTRTTPDGGTPPPTAPANPNEVAAGGPLFEVRSGSKLKARWLVGEGGARIFGGFSHGGFRCSFNWIEERTLCTPPIFQQPRPLFDAFHYADDRCTQPLLPKSRGLYVQYVHGRCPAAVAAYQTGTAPAEYTTAYQSDGQRCWQVPEEKVPGGRYLGMDVTATLPGGKLVRGAERSGWVPLFSEGDDGSRAFAVWTRVRDGAFCEFGLTDAAAGQGRCLPLAIPLDTARVQSFFSDAQCTTPAAAGGFPAPCDGAVFVRGESSGCESGPLHEAGPRLTEPFARGGGACGPVPSSAASYAVGAPVSRETFPAGTLRVVAGPGRLRPLVTDGPLGLTPVSDAFWDRQLMTACRVTQSSLGGPGDPGERCEPLARTVESALFSDAACTSHVVSVSPCGATHAFGRHYVFLGAGGGTFTNFYRLRGAYRGPVFDRKDGTCVPHTPEGGRQLLAAERLEPETTFATVTLQTDP